MGKDVPKWTMCYAARITPTFNPESGQYDVYDLKLITSVARGPFGIDNGGISSYVHGGMVEGIPHDNTQWTVFCMKSEPGADPSKQALLDGVGVCSNPHTIAYDHALQIGYYWTNNPWYVTQILVWDVLLSDAEMQKISDKLMTHFREGEPMASGCDTPDDKFCGDVCCIYTPGFAGPADGPCEACAVGKYKKTTVTGGCSECVPGSFTDVSASTVCALYPTNTFSSSTGAQKCTACPNLT